MPTPEFKDRQNHTEETAKRIYVDFDNWSLYKVGNKFLKIDASELPDEAIAELSLQSEGPILTIKDQTIKCFEYDNKEDVPEFNIHNHAHSHQTRGSDAPMHVKWHVSQVAVNSTNAEFLLIRVDAKKIVNGNNTEDLEQKYLACKQGQLDFLINNINSEVNIHYVNRNQNLIDLNIDTIDDPEGHVGVKVHFLENENQKYFLTKSVDILNH